MMSSQRHNRNQFIVSSGKHPYLERSGCGVFEGGSEGLCAADNGRVAGGETNGHLRYDTSRINAGTEAAGPFAPNVGTRPSGAVLPKAWQSGGACSDLPAVERENTNGPCSHRNLPKDRIVKEPVPFTIVIYNRPGGTRDHREGSDLSLSCGKSARDNASEPITRRQNTAQRAVYRET